MEELERRDLAAEAEYYDRAAQAARDAVHGAQRKVDKYRELASNAEADLDNAREQAARAEEESAAAQARLTEAGGAPDNTAPAPVTEAAAGSAHATAEEV